MQSASIRSRLLVAFTALSLMVILVGSNLTYSLVKDVLYSELDHFLRDKLNYQQIAAAQVEDRVIFRLSEPILDMLQDPKGKDFFQFRYVENGREIFKSSLLPDNVSLPKIGLEENDFLKTDEKRYINELIDFHNIANKEIKLQYDFDGPYRNGNEYRKNTEPYGIINGYIHNRIYDACHNENVKIIFDGLFGVPSLE